MSDVTEVGIEISEDTVFAVGGPVELIGGPVVVATAPAAGSARRSLRMLPELTLMVDDEPVVYTGRPLAFWPGHQQRVRIAVDVGSLAPGRYAGRLRLDQLEVDADAFVTESHDLTVSPTTVVVPNRPGEPVRTAVVCRNDGNVRVFVGGVGPVELFDEQAKAKRSQNDRLEPVGHLEIAVRDGEGEEGWLAPGRTAVQTWEVVVPPGLRTGTLYNGTAPLDSTTVSFLVVPDSAAGSRPGAGPARAPRRRPPATGTKKTGSAPRPRRS
jgi:hypothetical protein